MDTDAVVSLVRVEGCTLQKPPQCPVPVYALASKCWQQPARKRPGFAVVHTLAALFAEEDPVTASARRRRENKGGINAGAGAGAGVGGGDISGAGVVHVGDGGGGRTGDDVGDGYFDLDIDAELAALSAAAKGAIEVGGMSTLSVENRGGGSGSGDGSGSSSTRRSRGVGGSGWRDKLHERQHHTESQDTANGIGNVDYDTSEVEDEPVVEVAGGGLTGRAWLKQGDGRTDDQKMPSSRFRPMKKFRRSSTAPVRREDLLAILAYF